MSQWSTCNAILEVYTYKELPNFKELLQIALDSAPRITGSEGDCIYTIVDLVKGKSSDYPCSNCPIYEVEATSRTKYVCPGISSGLLGKNDFRECIVNNLPNELRTGLVGYYDRCKIVITDMHGLRDKSKEDTMKEFKELLKYLRTVFNKTFEVEVITKHIK